MTEEEKAVEVLNIQAAAKALSNAFPKQSNSRIDNIGGQNSSPVKFGN